MVDLGEPAPVMKDEIDEAFKRIHARTKQIKAIRHELQKVLDENQEDINMIKKECGT